MNAPCHHSIISTNDIHLHVVQAGREDGIPVILLHGFPEFWYGWRNQIDALVEAGFCLYIPDQRGYNLSDKPQEIAAYNLDLLAADIVGLIDYIGVEKIRLVGHDWGGGVAWWLANKYPERLEKLTVLNIPHHAAFSRALRDNPAQKRKSWYMAFFQLPIIPELLIRAGNGLLFAKWAFKDSPGFSAEDIQLYKQAWAQPEVLTGMLNWYRAVRKTRPARLPSPRIQVPTLLIWGKRDPVFEPEIAQQSIDLCDDGRLVYIDHATHWVQHDAAEEVNRLLIDWLKT